MICTLESRVTVISLETLSYAINDRCGTFFRHLHMAPGKRGLYVSAFGRVVRPQPQPHEMAAFLCAGVILEGRAIVK